MTKVSVIIPVYNIEEFLTKCLDSVINQTYKNLEIICVNDGSTDNSQKILEEYAENDKRIKIINKPNGGLSSARNAGMREMNGKYCYFVDSDDWIELNTIETLVGIYDKYDVDCVVHSFRNIAYDDEAVQNAQDCENWLKTFQKFDGIYDIPIDISHEIPTVAWNKLYKTNIIKTYNCRFPEGFIHEDEAFIWIYMIHCKKYYYTNFKFYNYLSRANSIMGKRKKSIKILDLLKIHDIIYKVVKQYKNIDMYSDVLTENYLKHVHQIFEMMDKKYEKQAIKIVENYAKNVNNNKKIQKCYKKLKNKKKKAVLNFIFSLKNTGNKIHKEITILGFKIKLNKFKFLKYKLNIIKKDKIVLSNFSGKSYGCNPKYITEEILRQKLPYDIVWLVEDKTKEYKNFPSEVRFEDYYSLAGVKELLTAKVWIDNTRKPFFWENKLKKSKNQYYIQTWHGAIGIKKMEGDIADGKDWWKKWAKVDSKNIDCIISNSKFLTDLYKRETCFWYKGRVEQTGHPRNDIFFKSESERQTITEKVYSALGIEKNKKIILYVPTFRDDGDVSCLNIDFERLKIAIEEKYGNEYNVVLRLHPNVPADILTNFNNEYFINATLYPDIQELLLAADIVISDYSSCMFDFMLTRRPVFIYASDIEKYNTERGFYYPLESTPFPIATNNEELIENINNFNYDEYGNNVDKFLKEKGCVDDGHASERVVEIIKEYMK